jgi:hypothetical protein
MQIPGASDAIVDPFKLLHYLLSPEHPVGRYKARFFATLGYRRTNWRELQAELTAHACSQNAILIETTQHGSKYVVAQPVTGPNGRTAVIITVWIIRHTEHVPRLVTAYPGEIR